MLERSIERKLFNYVRSLRGRAIKLSRTGRKGDVDRILALPGGVTVWTEVKRPGKRPRADQMRVHSQLRRMGHKVLIVDGTNWSQTFTYLRGCITIALRRT